MLIENFRPGAMEVGAWSWTCCGPPARRWSCCASALSRPGPYRDRPGFGVVAEAMGGLRHLTGEPGRVPVRVGVSIGDTLASLHGVIGILMALQHRHATVSAEYPKGRGQVIDVALYEAVFNCMESLLPEYSADGARRRPAARCPASRPPAPTAAPTAMCSSRATATSIFKRLMQCIGRPDLAADPQLADNTGRVSRAGGDARRCDRRVGG